MLSRREVLAGGFAARFAGESGERMEAAQAGDREALGQIRRAIEQVEQSLDRGFDSLPMTGGYIAVLRKHFEAFIRGNGKFPDFCDVGTACFYQVYDWHVKNNQQIMASRQSDNRYTIQFMFTTLILRFENDATFVGIPYDKG